MKVLLVEHFLAGSIYTLELARELAAHAEVSIVCRRSVEPVDCGVKWLNFWYPGQAPKLKAAADYALTLLRLGKTILAGDYDVVHVESFMKEAPEMKVYRALRSRIKKLVFTVHNVLPHENSDYYRKLYAGWYALCDELIVHNEASRDCLLSNFDIPAEKVTVIAHGAYQSYAHVPDVPDPEGKRRYLQFGFIRPYKGVDVLVRAVALIPPETRQRMRFTIIGKQYDALDSTDYPALIRELGCGDCVEFRPESVANEDIPALFASHDLALFPYRNIYGSGSLLMSYTFGRPVIVSGIPTFREETDNGRTGVLFAPEDPADLARVLIESLDWDEAKLSACRTAIRELVETRYSWKISARKTAEIYRREKP